MKDYLKLVALIKKHKPELDESQLSLDTMLSDIGIDSLDYIELVFDIETEFELTFPDELLGEFKSISDIINFISKEDSFT